MNLDCVIVDANIAFKALASGRADLRTRLSPAAPLRYFAPRFLFVELFKHKERRMAATLLSEDEVLPRKRRRPRPQKSVWPNLGGVTTSTEIPDHEKRFAEIH